MGGGGGATESVFLFLCCELFRSNFRARSVCLVTMFFMSHVDREFRVFYGACSCTPISLGFGCQNVVQ